jgi:hypothetical protein
MNANQALWEKGDFTDIAAFMRESGEAVAKFGRDNSAMPLAVLEAEESAEPEHERGDFHCRHLPKSYCFCLTFDSESTSNEK